MHIRFIVDLIFSSVVFNPCVCLCVYESSFDELFELQQSLRATLLKLYVSDALLPTLPAGRCYYDSLQQCMVIFEQHETLTSG